jgi:putative transposase
MILNRGYSFRLYATEDQERTFAQWTGVCRAVYNAALFQREHFSRKGRFVGFHENAADLKLLRREFDWIGSVSQTAEINAIRDLDIAFKNFFSGRCGFPKPRRKFRDESFRIEARECPVRRLNASWGEVRLPKIGWIRFRQSREFPNGADFRTVTVIKIGIHWHASFAVRFKVNSEPNLKPAIGVDRGVANSIALSTGELASVPIERLRIFDRRNRKAQQEAARRKRGSKRYAKSRRRAAACKSKAARIRKHWNHQATTALVSRFGVVCIEDLKTSNMTASARGTVEEPGRNVRQKAGLNRSILEHGWYQFETFLTYKLAASGGTLVKVNPRNTSRTCPICGSIDARNRENQAHFRCIECGHEAHADVNAAINILRAGTRPSERAKVRCRESRIAA